MESVGIMESPPSERKAGARGAALRVLAAYLALTAVVLPLDGLAPEHLALLVVHLGGAAALLALARRPGEPTPWLGVLADWLPLLLVPVLYAELPLLMEGLPGPVRYHDPLIMSLEERLLGGQPAFAWAGAMPSVILSELLHACYVSYYALIYVPLLLLFARQRGAAARGAAAAGGPREDRRRAAFHESVLALSLSFLGCFLVFVVFPVQGPRYLGVPEGVPPGPVRALALAILETGSSRGAAFPSSHVAVAVTQALLALRHQPRAGRWVAAIAVGLACGAVYGGFHYGVDVLAGALVGAAAIPAAARVARRLGSGVQGA
jgi:membrane-associated phospholipid phosphatase